MAKGHSYTAPGGIEDLRENDTEEQPSNRIDDKQTDGVITEREHEISLTVTDTVKEELDKTPEKVLRESIIRETATVENEENKLTKLGTVQVKDEPSKKVLSTSIQSEKEMAQNSRTRRKTCTLRCKSLRNSNDKDLHRRELVDAWSKQLGVVEKIVDHMENVRRQRKSEFEDLLEDMETKRTTGKRVTEVESTTEVSPTVLTVVDETQVRTALKRDPLVRRILEMARMKREEFFRGLKENNITLSEWD